MLSLDAVDISKQHKANINEHVTKTRIMPDGAGRPAPPLIVSRFCAG